MSASLFNDLDLRPVPAANPFDPWGGYDWGKKSLAGAHIRFQLKEYGFAADDIGIIGKDDPRGLFVWEGDSRTVHHRTHDGDEYEDFLEGDLRQLTAEELAAVAAGRSPWDDEEWKLPTVPGDES